MKKSSGLVLGILLVATSVFAVNAQGKKSTLEIDTKASKVYWTGKKVTGEHTGYLSVANGTVNVDNNTVLSANLAMDMKSIVDTDLEAGEWNDKLIGHLKSDDFFSVEKFPLAKFTITSVKKTSGEEFTVVGNLTIKDITNEITFPAKIKVENGIVSAEGKATIDRTKWNVQYGSGKFFAGLGDKMIYDEFEIKFDIKTK